MRFEDTGHWRHACMRAFSLLNFAPDTVRLHKAGGGAEEPIYNQAFLPWLERRYGLHPPRPQIAARFAAQINSKGHEKIQAALSERRKSGASFQLACLRSQLGKSRNFIDNRTHYQFLIHALSYCAS